MTIPKYSKEVQERIDQEKAKNTPNIPTLHSNRIRLQGEEGLFYIREHDESGKMKAEENPLGKTPHQVWSGTILRIAYKVESKWKKDATEKEFTSEFDNFSNEPIDLLVRNFGADGKTELIKTYKNYKELKDENSTKDRKGDFLSWAYSLKVVLYVWQADRGELAKFVFGGSGLGEWFSFLSDGAKRGDGCLTKPYKTVEGAETLIQFQTEFKANKTKSDKGLEYYRLSLGVGKMNTNDEMKALFDEQEKIDGYVMGWKAKRLEVASPVLMPEKEEKKLEEESLDALDVVAPVEEA